MIPKESSDKLKESEFKSNPLQKMPDLREMNSSLRKSLILNDTVTARYFTDSIKFFIGKRISADSSDISDAFYLIGVYYSKKLINNFALIHFKRAAGILERGNRKKSVAYSRCLFNIGVTYANLGDFNQSLDYTRASVEVDKLLYSNKSVELADGYLALCAPYIRIRDYEKAIENANLAFETINQLSDTADKETLANLYASRGAAYSYLSDYSQARYNLEKAETFFSKLDQKDLNYSRALNNLGTVYHFLGSKEKTYYYYEKALKLAENNYTPADLILIQNYAIILGNDSLKERGEQLLSEFLRNEHKKPTGDLRNYYLVLRVYADYLRDFQINNNQALQLYLQCFSYSYTHPWDKDFRDNLILGYSLSLNENSNYRPALDSIQTLLFPGKSSEQLKGQINNPPQDSLKSDIRTIRILSTKYKILWNEYKYCNDIKLLEATASTLELTIAVLEKIRLNIGEEGSRLLLGDKYKNAYMDAIMCFNDCYIKTNNRKFLEKAFEYSEKSKVASLLASTREMKAIQNNIPVYLANLEKNIERSIGSYSSAMIREENSENPDMDKISLWKDYILTSTQRKDSLINVFEKSYPGYFALKYNTSVISMSKIPDLIGKGNSYLSYIVADSLLYIFVSNAKHQQLITQRIDSSFFRTVSEFRKILTNPDFDEDSNMEFHIFQVNGHKLYSYLIEPVKKYFTSGNLIISADNFLSYLPFETFITSDRINVDLLYKNLSYLMQDFRISYTYSATLLAENKKEKPSFRNRAIIFAPSYESPISIDSISIERQSSSGYLRALPSARDEAKFVSGITRGTLFVDTSASESAYKRLAGSFDIVHLAMHTYINNQNPGFSKMIFSVFKDSSENIGLNVFEIYGISLRAKMVVLSSCNTGSGNLRKGEGVLSLARGFIYSGSKSVVMSLWEVDDKSGTEIMKLFYRNLKNGNSKSESLRKARLEYLKSAGQLRSHPYYWSTLVVYGDDSPLYPTVIQIILLLLVPVILITGIIYYRIKR